LTILFVNISLKVQSQTAYDWYQTELSKKQSNDYWADVVVDTVIRLQLINTNTTAPASVRYGQAVNLESFLRNQAVIVPGNKTILSCTIYFTGKGFLVPQSVNMSGLSTLSGIHLLKNCETGTSLTFDMIALPDSNKEKFTLVGGCFLTDFQKKDLPVLTVDTTIIDAMGTLKRRFSRGTIYFTGTGFPVAESMPATESNASNRKGMISRMQPGTSIVFDNCNYWDAEKKTAVSVNKTIKLAKVSK
jgi:hypothetical protein